MEQLQSLPATPVGDAWPNATAPGVRYTELDMFEKFDSSPTDYTSSLHDWVYSSTNPRQNGRNNFESITVVKPNADFTQPHGYGVLWSPATVSSVGYVQYYFDKEPVGPVFSWSYYNCSAPPTTLAPAYGIIDCQHMLLHLNTGPGQPLRVYGVEVWQSSEFQNLKQ